MSPGRHQGFTPQVFTQVRNLALGCSLLGLTLPACSCDEELTIIFGDLEVTPERVDFGKVAVGLSREATVELKNAGIRVLKIESLSTEGPFSVQTFTSTLAPSRTREVSIFFNPQAVGPTEGKLLIASDDPEVPVTEVPLVGEGIEAAILVNPNPVDFETFLWTARTPNRFIEVTVSNPGTDSFDLTAITLTDDAGGDIQLELDDSTGTVAPQEQRKFRVVLAPSGFGSRNGNVQLSTTIMDLPVVDIPVLANVVGPIFEVCASAAGGPDLCTEAGETPVVDFGGPARGETVQGVIRFMNRGDRDLTIDGPMINGMIPGEITFTPALMPRYNVVLAPGEEASITSTYLPADYTPDYIGLIFSSDGAQRPTQMVPVNGRAARPIANLIPATITFSLEGSSTDAMAAIRVVNCGDLDMNITGAPSIMGDGSFTIVNPPSSGVIIPGDCSPNAPLVSFPVRFQPPAIGTYNAILEVYTDDPVNPTVTAELVGTKR